MVVLGSFGDLRSRDVRFLQEASRLGSLHVLLLGDEVARRLSGKAPKFPLEERLYFLEAVRYVDSVTPCVEPLEPEALPLDCLSGESTWVVEEPADTSARREFCRAHGLGYRIIDEQDLRGFPEDEPDEPSSASRGKKKVIVTGCYDWFHSGHVRFFEEVSELGDLYVVVGHDDNVRMLKGEGHPMFPAVQRRYMVGAIRHVRKALISSGDGWLDAEPEIRRIRPAIYAVNEDGDRPEKRVYCEAHGIEYSVLERLPKEGLPRRQSTELRGF